MSPVISLWHFYSPVVYLFIKAMYLYNDDNTGE